MHTYGFFGRGFAWVTLGGIIGKLLIIFNIFIILRHLTVYEYGVTELTFSVVSAASLFFLPGLAAGVTADLAVERAQKNYGKMKTMFRDFTVLTFCLGLAAWAILFFGSSIVANFAGNDLVSQYFKIVSFLFLTGPFRLVTAMLATVMVRYVDQSFLSVVEETAKGALLLFFFYVLDLRAEGVLYAAVGAQVLAVIAFSPRTYSAFRLFSHATADARVSLSRTLMGHRKWGVASSYTGTMGQNIRTWIIKLLLGTEAVGLIAFVQGMIAQLSGLLNLATVAGPYLPTLMSDQPRLHSFIRRVTKYQLALGSGTAILAALGTSLFVTIFFPAYIVTIPLIIVCIPSIIPNLIKSFHLTVFIAFKQQKGWYVIETLRIVFMVVVLPLSIMVFGIYGYAVEMLVGSTLVMAERWRALKRIVPGLRFVRKDFYTIDETDKQLVVQLVGKLLSVGRSGTGSS